MRQRYPAYRRRNRGPGQAGFEGTAPPLAGAAGASVSRAVAAGEAPTLAAWGCHGGAYLARRPSKVGHTGVLAIIGSPKPIAPEQVRGLRSDPASDVYAFGAMMYELLCGEPVFPVDGAADAV